MLATPSQIDTAASSIISVARGLISLVAVLWLSSPRLRRFGQAVCRRVWRRGNKEKMHGCELPTDSRSLNRRASVSTGSAHMTARVELHRSFARLAPGQSPWLPREAIGEIWGEPAGEPVQIWLSRGELLGYGLVSRQGEPAVRMLSYGDRPLPEDWLESRLRRAIMLRRRLALSPRTTGYCYVNGEGDGLPGLMIERFESMVRIQFATAAMLQHRFKILEIVEQLIATPVLVDVLAGAAREVGGRAEFIAVNAERLPDVLSYREDGVSWTIPCLSGEKGSQLHLFRAAKIRVAQLASQLVAPSGGKFLELGCRYGGFSLHAGGRGLATLGVVSDAFALRFAGENAKANNFSETQWLRADPWEYLEKNPPAAPLGCLVAVWPIVQGAREVRQATQKMVQWLSSALGHLATDGIVALCLPTGAWDESTIDRMVASAGLSHEQRPVYARIGTVDPELDHPRALGHDQAFWPRTHLFRRLA